MLLFISISIHSIKPGIHDLHCMLQLFWHSLPCTWLLCCYCLQPCHTQPPGRHWRVLAVQTRTLWPWETLYCHLFPSASGGRKSCLFVFPFPINQMIVHVYNLTCILEKESDDGAVGESADSSDISSLGWKVSSARSSSTNSPEKTSSSSSTTNGWDKGSFSKPVKIKYRLAFALQIL